MKHEDLNIWPAFADLLAGVAIALFVVLVPLLKSPSKDAMAQLKAKQEKADADLTECSKDRSAFKAGLENCEERLSAKQAEIQRVVQEVEQRIRNTSLRYEVTGYSIAFADNAQFETGDATLKDAFKGVLGDLCVVFRDVLQGNSGIQLDIEGHTDNRPVRAKATERKYKDNYGLSSERALAILREFEKCGLGPPAYKVAAIGYGAQHPWDGRPIDESNATDEGRQKNRRTEFRFVPYEAPSQNRKLDSTSD